MGVNHRKDKSISHMLVLGAGAGSDVLQAIYHSARRVDAVGLDKNVAELGPIQFREFAGDLYDRPDVTRTKPRHGASPTPVRIISI